MAAADPPPAPVVVVLGAAVFPDGEPSPALRRRLDAARAWADSRTDHPIFLVTGGLGIYPPEEALVMAAYLEAAGIPSDRIVREPVARTTLGSVALCRQIIRSRFADHPLYLCSHAYHLRRARLSFQAVGIRFDGTVSVHDCVRESGMARFVYQRLREVPGTLFDIGAALALSHGLPPRIVFRRTEIDSFDP